MLNVLLQGEALGAHWHILDRSECAALPGGECKGVEEAGNSNGREVVEVVVAVVNGPGAGAAAGGGLSCQNKRSIAAQSEIQPCSMQPSLAETEEARHRAATERRRFGCARGGGSCAAGS